MNEEQIKTIRAVVKWMEVCEDSNYELPKDSLSLYIHMTKSSLLDRLLSGKKPFKFPPPKSYSYPWYSLLEAGEHAGYMPVWETNDFRHLPMDKLVIDQHDWFIIENLGDGEYLVSYNLEEGSIWKVRPLNFDETYRVIRDMPRLDKSHESILAQVDRNKEKYNKISLVTPGKNKLED